MLSHYIDSISFTTYEIKCLISKVKTKLHQQFTDEWQTEMLDMSTFEIEKYLYIFNKNHRQALLRFHQSSHDLEVEKGKWWRKLIMVNGTTTKIR